MAQLPKLQLTEEMREFIRMVEAYQQLKSIHKILSKESCKDVLIDRKFRDKFGLGLPDLVSDVIQRFYEMGKEDAFKNLEINNASL
jgi:hypothetical protein